jgi:hypothetical protein
MLDLVQPQTLTKNPKWDIFSFFRSLIGPKHSNRAHALSTRDGQDQAIRASNPLNTDLEMFLTSVSRDSLLPYLLGPA